MFCREIWFLPSHKAEMALRSDKCPFSSASQAAKSFKALSFGFLARQAFSHRVFSFLTSSRIQFGTQQRTESPSQVQMCVPPKCRAHWVRWHSAAHWYLWDCPAYNLGGTNGSMDEAEIPNISPSVVWSKLKLMCDVFAGWIEVPRLISICVVEKIVVT